MISKLIIIIINIKFIINYIIILKNIIDYIKIINKHQYTILEYIIYENDIKIIKNIV